MSTQIQLDFNTIFAIIALAISTITFFRSGSWHNRNDTKTNATVIATILEKVDNIEKAVHGIPEMREKIVINEQALKSQDQRLSTLERKRCDKE